MKRCDKTSRKPHTYTSLFKLTGQIVYLASANFMNFSFYPSSFKIKFTSNSEVKAENPCDTAATTAGQHSIKFFANCSHEDIGCMNKTTISSSSPPPSSGRLLSRPQALSREDASYLFSSCIPFYSSIEKG